MSYYPYFNTEVELNYYVEPDAYDEGDDGYYDVYEVVELNLETIHRVLKLHDDIESGLLDENISYLYTGLMVFLLRFNDMIDDELKYRIFNVMNQSTLPRLDPRCWIYILIFNIYPDKNDYIINKLLTRLRDLSIIMQLIAIKPDLLNTERDLILSKLTSVGLKHLMVGETNLEWFLHEFPELIVSDVILQSTIFTDEFNIVLNSVRDVETFLDKLLEFVNHNSSMDSGKKELVELSVGISRAIDFNLGMSLLVDSNQENKILNMSENFTHDIKLLVKRYAFASPSRITLRLWKVIEDVTELDELQPILNIGAYHFKGSTIPKSVEFLNYLLDSNFDNNILLDYMGYAYGSSKLDDPQLWEPLVLKALGSKPQSIMVLLTRLPQLDSNLKHILLNRILTNWK